MSELWYTVLGLTFLGVAFLGVYFTDRERRWWAVIPGLGAFTLIAAIAVDVWIGTDPSNDWASVLVVAGGAAVIATVLSRDDAKLVLDVVAGITLAVGILMTPIAIWLKVAFVALLAIGAGAIALRDRRDTHSTAPRLH